MIRFVMEKASVKEWKRLMFVLEETTSELKVVNLMEDLSVDQQARKYVHVQDTSTSTTEQWSTYNPIFMYPSAAEEIIKIGRNKYPHLFGFNISDSNNTATAPLGNEHLEDSENSTTLDNKRKTSESSSI
jgi:hypothetical protein